MGLPEVIRLLITLLILAPLDSASAFWQSRDSNYNTSVVVSVTYQGVGDLKTGAYAYYSCARAYTAAYAAAAGKACRVVKTSDGSGGCDLVFSSDGFVHAPATQCPTECGVACSVTKAYDETGNVRDVANATLAQMPTLTISAINSLPGLACAQGAVCLLITAGTQSASQPINFSFVADRTTAVGTANGVVGSSNGDTAGYSAAANTVIVSSGSSLGVTASDNSYHAINSVANGASTAINVDGGTDTTGTIGTGGWTADTLRLFRAGGGSEQITLMEAVIWQGSAFTQTDRQNISTNQHSATNGYNF